MIVITGSTLIDGTGVPPVEDAVIVVEGERVQAVGRMGGVPVPSGPGVTVLNAGGKTVMPGIIDAHDHLAHFGHDLGVRHDLTEPRSLIHMRTAAVLRDTLASGTTTVRDGGGLDLGFKLAVEQGLIPGPRLRLGLMFISPTGGVGDRSMVSGITFPPRPGIPLGIADGPDAVRAKVREMVRAGADVIKTATTGGVHSPRHGPLDPEYSRAEIDAVVDEANILGKKVMCHALGGPGLRMAVEAGVHSIEHGGYLDLDPDIPRMMADKGIFYVPTFLVYVYHGSERAGAPYMRQRAQAMREHHVKSLQMATQAGVKIAMGTDAGAYAHGEHAKELALMVEGGMTPMQAIVASTRTAAACLEMEQEVGTLEAGRLADLLVVDGDPLQEITVLQDRERLHHVMKGGEPVADNGL